MAKIKLLVILLWFCQIPFSAISTDKISQKVKTKIENQLSKQVLAWNEGNLELFMETYLKSENLVFVGSRGPTYGWQATLENYKKSYPSKKEMGTLNFEILKISKIDRKSVFVIGKFSLTSHLGNQKGTFTLVFKKINGNWLIVSDHSSATK